MTYPDTLEIVPLQKPPMGTVRVPGSKSITNRALVLAALTDTGCPCELRGALCSEDTEVMIHALTRLGFHISTAWDLPEPSITVCNGWGTLAPSCPPTRPNCSWPIREPRCDS